MYRGAYIGILDLNFIIERLILTLKLISVCLAILYNISCAFLIKLF